MVDLVAAAAGVDTTYAPPATVWEHLSAVSPLSCCPTCVENVEFYTFLHARQFQMPVEWRLTVVLPQNVQVYLACCEISIFLTCFRRDAPYLCHTDQH